MRCCDLSRCKKNKLRRSFAYHLFIGASFVHNFLFALAQRSISRAHEEEVAQSVHVLVHFEADLLALQQRDQTSFSPATH